MSRKIASNLDLRVAENTWFIFRLAERCQATGLVFKLQKVDGSITSHQLKFSMRSSTLSCLICAQNLLDWLLEQQNVVLYWPKVAQKMLSTMGTGLFTNTIGQYSPIQWANIHQYNSM